MAIRVGINGFGRIGRVVIRAAMDMPEIEIRAINLRNADLEYMVYMLKYDTVFGRFPKALDHDKIVKLIRENGGERYVKSFDGFTHLLTMLYAVIMRFDSLREIEAAMTAEVRKLQT